MAGLPAGTVTFLFTDIEGSTRHWEQTPGPMSAALARHDLLLRRAIEDHGGYVFKTVGDAFCAAFSTPHPALQAAMQAQTDLNNERWNEATGPVRVRIAVHTGVAEERDGDYFGQPINRVARILSAGHGGQTLLSNATYDLVRDSLPTGVQVLDLGAHRLKDLIRSENLFNLVIQGLPGQFPPLKSLDARPNNLPRQATPLIGRGKEVEKICALLRGEHTGLVTLTGPGGTGKTRLGLQAAADLLDDFADGVWLVDLSPITDAGLVISTIAQTLGVREAGGQSLADTLKAYLREKQLLLLLDNFEQVAGAASRVGDLLLSCPGVKALVTSRVPLRIRGEKEYPVSPLGLPDYHHLPALPQLTQYEAVRLFIDRATDIKPDFEVNNDNAPAVAEICVRLDGLPLAIELAAARIRLFPPQALLARLSNRLKLLTGGAQNVPARQQTLLNTMEWSYDLLAPGEQQLFRRMAVFQGGRTLEALDAMCNYDGQLAVDVLEGVDGLVEGNLLYQRQGIGGEARFWMLEMMHEYARQKLEESGEAGGLQRKHANFFMRFAEEVEPHLNGPSMVKWLDRVEDEHDNMRAALRWAIDMKQTDVALAICGGIGEFWVRRGYHTEGWEWVSNSLSLVSELTGYMNGPAESKSLRARALLRASRLAGRRSDGASAHLLAEESLALYTEVGDKAGMAEALISFVISSPMNDPNLSTDKERPYWEEVIKLARESKFDHGMAQALYYLGDLAMNRGDIDLALHNYGSSLELSRNGGYMPMAALALVKLGGIARTKGDYVTASAQYEESLDIYRQLGDRWASTYALGNLGALAHEQGDDVHARSIFQDNLALGRESGFKVIVAAMLGNLGAICIIDGDYDSARPLVEESLALAKAIEDEAGISMQLYLLGNILLHEGDPEGAADLFRESLQMAAREVIQRGHTYSIHEVVACLTSLGSLQLSCGYAERAITLLGASQTLRKSLIKRYVMEGAVQSSIDRIEHERTLSLVHTLLETEKWQATWTHGATMTLEQAIAYVLEESDE